jgi:hypothetical protein
MTHSIFCLYIKEKYAKNVGREIIQKRVKLMNRRGYPKFEQFNNILLKTMSNNQKSVYDSYEEIINEMKQIK